MTLPTVLIISFLLISSLGTVLHFTHGWFKNGLLLHIFSATNESTWEHMKLLVLPTIVTMVFQYQLIGNQYSNFFNSILVLFLVEILSIPLLYEPLRMLFKEVHFSITILIFYLAVLFGILSQYFILTNQILVMSESIAMILIALIVISFGIFTYFPPKFFIFRDPVTGKYGDVGHNEV